MEILIIVGLVLAATLQADARAIAHQELPKVLRETMEQSFACALQLGPDAANVPSIQDLDITQFPEDNPALNTLTGCIWEKKGIIDKQGVVYPEKLNTYLVDLLSLASAAGIDVDRIASEVTENCTNVEGGDYKVKSIKMQNCMNRHLSTYKYV